MQILHSSLSLNWILTFQLKVGNWIAAFWAQCSICISFANRGEEKCQKKQERERER